MHLIQKENYTIERKTRSIRQLNRDYRSKDRGDMHTPTKPERSLVIRRYQKIQKNI